MNIKSQHRLHDADMRRCLCDLAKGAELGVGIQKTVLTIT